MRASSHFALWMIGMAQAETQTTDAERLVLAKHAAGRRRLVEIGTWHGVTTCRLRTAMSSNGTLFAVDPYPRGRLGISFQRLIAMREVGRIRNGNVRWLRMTGAAAARFYRSNERQLADFVFIDGDHSYEGLKSDWEGWRDLVQVDGIVALHDSHPTPTRSIEDAGSVRFTNDVILRETSYRRIEIVDSLTVLQRTG